MRVPGGLVRRMIGSRALLRGAPHEISVVLAHTGHPRLWRVAIYQLWRSDESHASMSPGTLMAVFATRVHPYFRHVPAIVDVAAKGQLAILATRVGIAVAVAVTIPIPIAIGVAVVVIV